MELELDALITKAAVGYLELFGSDANCAMLSQIAACQERSDEYGTKLAKTILDRMLELQGRQTAYN